MNILNTITPKIKMAKIKDLYRCPAKGRSIGGECGLSGNNFFGVRKEIRSNYNLIAIGFAKSFEYYIFFTAGICYRMVDNIMDLTFYNQKRRCAYD